MRRLSIVLVTLLAIMAIVVLDSSTHRGNAYHAAEARLRYFTDVHSRLQRLALPHYRPTCTRRRGLYAIALVKLDREGQVRLRGLSHGN